MRFNLHGIIEPLSSSLNKILWLSKLSRWRRITPVTGMNDFYTSGYEYENRYKLYAFLLEKYALIHSSINYMEFGVEEGNSLKWWAEHNKNASSCFLGLDTFTGLPEKWGNFKKGDMIFSKEKITLSDSRVFFFEGLFQHTTNQALEQLNPTHRTIFHMDADLFSSTLFALTQCYRCMKPGDLIIFDEFSTPTHEFQAFHLFTSTFYIRYEVVAAACNFSFVAIEIKK